MDINVIKVENTTDVVHVSKLFEKIGLNIFSSEETRDKFLQMTPHGRFDKGFLIKPSPKPNHWNVESFCPGFALHDISRVISITQLEDIINETLEKNPNYLKEKFTEELTKELEELEKEFDGIKKRFSDLQDKISKLK